MSDVYLYDTDSLSTLSTPFLHEGSGDFKFFFVNKVFAGWDFGISDFEAKSLKQKSLRQEISEYISLVHAKAKTRKRDKGFAREYRCTTYSQFPL